MNHPTSAQIAEVCRLLIEGKTQAEARRATGIGVNTVHKMWQSLVQRGSVKVDRRRVDVEAMTLLFDDATKSSRAIGKELGCDETTVLAYRRKYEAGLVARGIAIPTCGCGEHIRHSGWCAARRREEILSRGEATVITLSEARREELDKRLASGESPSAIGKSIGLTWRQVSAYGRNGLSPMQREKRRQAREVHHAAKVVARRARQSGRETYSNASDPRKDDLFAEIDTVVPRYIDPALRDDIRSQTYLEVLDGTIVREALRAGVKRVQARMFTEFASRWGTVSLDEPSGTSRMTLAELIPESGGLYA